MVSRLNMIANLYTLYVALCFPDTLNNVRIFSYSQHIACYIFYLEKSKRYMFSIYYLMQICITFCVTMQFLAAMKFCIKVQHI